ncbi:hypothetical protein GE21DRAFT_9792 [Neurospora crassa]|uniref:Uncharacterized protein n=1 Tax=Neurospora crassa (strain ATCC 24698 / 74-OR23-1A / CBS 708.71 / DSM 1257 / FGSC 987) TaxID=367110 RepID=Q7S3G4_NEUCR|nr:hypothetical protein NCU06889 [Neurospora crassa OR74A]EAA30000.1 hypothetical protein NCU06889 [Neurospora crassa OR74A]KHE82563.1 hypothetical protein GE21DRAFT_9792 [Neurospora crassa]|eukprot:XP_959236.1 hypothetical protein NCU06889 [Neurospora crassa OR74A]
MASTSCIEPLASPDWVSRSRSPENWGPTSLGPVPFSPPYIPRSLESTPGSTSPADYLYYPTSPGPVPPSPPYIPQSPESVPGSVSPEGNYYPTSPGPGPQSPAYLPRSSEWVSTSPPSSILGPTSPPPVLRSPACAYTPYSPQSVSRGTSPTYYYPTSPGPVPPSPPYIPRSPVWAFRDTSPDEYHPTSPGPGPQTPAYTPSSPQWVSGGMSPTNYYPTSPGPVPPSPPYIPRSPEWWSTSSTPVPQSPADIPTSPQSGYRGTSSEKYYPTSPGPVPPSPPYVPQSPHWASTSPTPVPLSPLSPAATDPFNKLERELDGSWGRGRFVCNRARSIVAEEEEEQRQRGERETTIEPFPELPYWEEDESTGRETEDDVQDIIVREPAAAVPEEEEGGLPDYQYYEQLDQDTAAETLIRMETEHSVVDNPYTAIAALNCEPQSNPFPSYPSSEIGMHQDAREEHANWFSSSSSSFRSSSAINNPACLVPQKLMGCVKVQKRIDRMMWNKLMQKKMVRMMEACEKYVPADVLRGLKQ